MSGTEIVKVFHSNVCPNCQKTKAASTGFCVRCYRSLPKAMQNAMWNRFGQGFEEAFNAAVDYFAKKKI